MASAAGTLETVAVEIGRALQPLGDLLDAQVFVKLGIELPRDIAGDATLFAALNAGRTQAAALAPQVAALESAIAGGDALAIVAAGAPLIATIGQLVAKLTDVGNALHQAANGLPAADRAALQGLAANLAQRVLEYLVVGYLAERLPNVTRGAALLGILDIEADPDPALEVAHATASVPRRLHLDRLPLLLQHPDQYLQQTFGWGDAGFDGSALLLRLQAFIEGLGVPAVIDTRPGQPPVLEAFAFAASADTSVAPPGLKFDLALPGATTFDRTIDFSTLWKGTVHAKADYAAGLEVKLRPPFAVQATPPSGNVAVDLALGLKATKTDADPIVILGLTGGTRLQATSIGGSLGVAAAFGPGGGAVAPTLQMQIDGGKLVIDFSQGDGFVQTLLSGVHVEAPFALAATWSPAAGLKLSGQGGVEVFIPLHLDLSVVRVDGLYVDIGFGSPAPLTIGLATQITAQLGPIAAAIDHIGVDALITFPAGGGRLGLADVDFRFHPPRGVGLSVDAGVISGGGFLYLDPDKGEYFGALELSFEGFISLKAIGIINTKMPDGSQGFALLILITAEFAPIQLGFGFTLIGVGGLIGVNRTVNVDALKTGVRTGAITSVLFPQDVVANIVRIVSDLKAIFPIAQDHFLIGPMGKIGWGTPTLISLELGVVIDIPVPRIIILGVLRCLLPTEDVALLKLQVNFAGGIDFDQGLIWFDASLFDSSILIYTLTGDMALRIGWNDPMLVISVGGFHPAFKEVPSDLTGMKRIMISLLSGDNPRLSSATYFAVTSNTVQSGARVELYAEAAGFNVYGFLGYDLLVQFSPFHFIADIAAGLALREGNDEIAGIHVSCELSGPTPFHAEGDASLTILFFSIDVGFSATWGDDGPLQPVELVDVLALVKTALEDKRNWKADLPANTNQGVSLRKIELADGDIVVHPFSVLAVSQKVVPLGLPIDRFGTKKPSTDTLFALTCDEGGTETVDEEFALSNFVTLNDDQKVSRKSFEQMPSGLRLTPQDATAHGFEMQKDVDYELSYVHRSKGLTVRAGLHRLYAGIFGTLVGGGSIAASRHSVAKRVATCAPAKVVIADSDYLVVGTDDLAVHAGMTATSQAAAYAMHAAAVAADPSLHGRLQVVSRFELAEA